MDLRQLRYYIGVCEAGSVLQASSRLHIAQPALSQQIAALEDELGIQLFVRTSRGMLLTEAGLLFREHVDGILTSVQRARQAMRDFGATPHGEVAIGLPTTVALVAAVPLLTACRARYPEIRLKLIEAYSGHLGERLQTGRLDLSILFGEDKEPELHKLPLLDDRLVLLTTAQQRPRRKRIALEALPDWPLVLPGQGHGLRRIIDAACQPLGVQLQVVAEIESLGSVKKAVMAGIGGTILPMSAVAQELQSGQLYATELQDLSMLRRVVCATSSVRPATAAAKAVQELLVEVLRGMVERGEWPGSWVGPEAS